MTASVTQPSIFAGRRVLFVMAAEAELGPKLRQRITPLMTGVGPVEAAVTLTAGLSTLERDGNLPQVVVSLGSAGSRVLEHGRVYQASDVSYRDMDASPLGFAKGETPFLGLPATLVLPYIVPGLPRAGLSTGAGVISGFGYDAIRAEMVDMETYAVCRAASRFRLPLIALRGISDGHSELTRVEDWSDSLELIDRNLAEALDRLADAFTSDAIPLPAVED